MAKILEVIKTCLDDGQAENIVIIDLDETNALADHIVISSGSNTRHVAALAERVAESLKKQANIHARIEGLSGGNWVLVDAGDVILHIFRPEVRAYYQLEDMWEKTGEKNNA